MLRPTCFLSAAVNLICACAPSTRTQINSSNCHNDLAKNDSIYCMTSVGSTCDYKYSSGSIMSLTVSHVVITDDSPTITIDRIVNGDKPHTYVVYKSTHDGLYIVRDYLNEWDRPICHLRLPHVDGVTWQANTRVRPTTERIIVDDTWNFTAYGPEEVQVPAGTFRAIRVVSERVNFGNKHTTWYAQGIGIVKIEMSAGIALHPTQDTLTLLSYCIHPK
jgi:hypothetical protein